MYPLSLIPLSLLLFILNVHAAKFPFVGRSVKRTVTTDHPLLRGRANISGQAGGSNASVPVANTHNAEYIANLTLGGQSIPVMLDTGRFVLWRRLCYRSKGLDRVQFGLMGCCKCSWG